MLTLDDIRSRLLDTNHGRSRVVLTIEGYRSAGVLVPIVNGVPCTLLLTQRTEFVETHKGQICFPGGMADLSDEDVVETALREAEEELGIPAEAVEIAGLLDDIATPSGFVITPVVGLLREMPVLSPSTSEVAEVFQVPVDFFADPASGRKEIREHRGAAREVWFYEHGGRVIWGATALMIRSLLTRLALL